MSEIQVNPDLVINELLENIKKLTFDNVVLKTMINQITQEAQKSAEIRSKSRQASKENDV